MTDLEFKDMCGNELHASIDERGVAFEAYASDGRPGVVVDLREADTETLAIALIQATPPDDQQEADVSDGDEDHLLLFGRTKIHRDDAIRLGLALIRAANEAK